MIKQWLGIRGFHYYRSGRRTWVRIGRGTITLESHFLSSAVHFHFGVDLGGGDADREMTLSMGVKHLFDFYLTLDHPWLERVTLGEMHESTTRPGKVFKMARKTFVGVRIFSGGIWVSLWENQMESSSHDPWWWVFSVHPFDILFGRRERQSVFHHSEETEVIFPERIYPVRVSFCDVTWKRKRWPFVKRIRQANIELPVPIPAPGKGESSWDCGEDAISSMSVNTPTLDEAVLGLLASVNRDRVRYGGPTWVPS